jgi:putative chitinase
MNRSYFFKRVRESVFGGKLSQKQVDGMTRLLDVWERDYADQDYRYLAYCLATVKLETAHTMLPVREYGKGKGRRYGVKTGPYGQVYYGRGDVQLTWEKNYRRMSPVVGEDLVRFPDRALDPHVSAKILFVGMMDGMFTGKKLSDYIAGEKCDFEGARRIVNGTDKAKMIAGYAYAFADALYQAAQEVDERDPEYIEGDQTTGKPATQSTTIWSQIATIFTSMGASVLAFFQKVDPTTLVIILAFIAIMAGLWVMRERFVKSSYEGV